MASLSFIYPEMLWLLVLLGPLVAPALAKPRRISLPRFAGMLVLRGAVLVALIFSLAGAQIAWPVDALTTIFLLDNSDSVGPSARGRALAFLHRALEAMRPDDQAGVVVFGENALVERAPSPASTLGRLASAPVAAHTDIEEALRLGLALFPTETQKRLVLLSDGSENTGEALTAARLAAARGIPVDVVDLSGAAAREETLISALEAPGQAREGQTFDLIITVESSSEQNAHLLLFSDEEIITDQYVHLAAGTNRFRFATSASKPGFRRFRATIAPEADQRPQNNEAAALVRVLGAPRVLLVEGQPGEARNLDDALAAASMTTEVVAPAALPTSLTSLGNYEAVVLINVPAHKLPPDAMTALPAYVRDLGKGLMMIGGTRSYGAGGYGHTPIEEVLPLTMGVRDREERPNLAIVFAIDKSGSMDACHCAGPERQTAATTPTGDRKVDIAREAVIQASATLGPHDSLSIVAFDSEAYQVLPASTAPSAADVAEAVAAIEPRGATNVGAGLHEARDILSAADARIKHIILLTDGWGEGTNYRALAEQLQEQSITLSVIAAGSGSAAVLESLAHAGGGRYYPVDDIRNVPQIFLQETILAAGNYIVETPFVPAPTSESAMLDGLEERLPILYGINGTTIKQTARPLLVSHDDMPVLATWHYGLGRSIAWTSDMKGKWGRDLVQWEEFPRFAAQLVGWVLPTTSSEGLAATIQVEGTQTTIAATLHDASSQPREQAQVSATLLASSGEPASGQPGAPPREIALSQVAPGDYRTTLPNPLPGTYLVQLVGKEDGNIVAQETVGLAVPYSSEYRQHKENPALLTELMRRTGGTPLATPEQSFAPTSARVVRAREIGLPLLWLALLLLPLDIALRRIFINRRDVAQGQDWLRRQWPVSPASRSSSGHAPQVDAAPDPVLSRLARAKQRAAARHSTRKPPPEPPAAGSDE